MPTGGLLILEPTSATIQTRQPPPSGPATALPVLSLTLPTLPTRSRSDPIRNGGFSRAALQPIGGHCKRESLPTLTNHSDGGIGGIRGGSVSGSILHTSNPPEKETSGHGKDRTYRCTVFYSRVTFFSVILVMYSHAVMGPPSVSFLLISI
jgi:hypothetical protein